MSASANRRRHRRLPVHASIDQENTPFLGVGARYMAATVDSLILAGIQLPALLNFVVLSNIAILVWTDLLSEIFKVPSPFEFAINFILPIFAATLFWRYIKSTPGLRLVGAEIVDARTGGAVTLPQSFLRAALMVAFNWTTFGLWLFSINYDKRRQGWHDKLARTYVVRRG